uniref:Uncharacterized protein n=1 Tax=Meloidogyne hapla TaxID=6305 RepID=A0A1I8BKT4_MELHA
MRKFEFYYFLFSFTILCCFTTAPLLRSKSVSSSTSSNLGKTTDNTNHVNKNKMKKHFKSSSLSTIPEHYVGKYSETVIGESSKFTKETSIKIKDVLDNKIEFNLEEFGE